MGKHARLSGSKAHRWMNCAGSVTAEEEIVKGAGEKPSSQPAMQGTAAHTLGAHCIEHNRDPYELRGVWIDQDDCIYSEERVPRPVPEGFFEVDDDMASAVTVYLETVAAAREETPCADELVERQLDELRELHPDLGGQGDYIRAEHFGLLHVIDYKHGAGVVVEVEENEQLLEYGVGAHLIYPDCDRVRITIVQPRAPHPHGRVRSVEYSIDELYSFRERMLEAADCVDALEPRRFAGDWCMWCLASGDCPAQDEEISLQTLLDFADEPGEIRVDGDLARKQAHVPFLRMWCKAVEERTLDALTSGVEVPGFKVITGGGGHRRWIGDEATVLKGLRKIGVKKADAMEPAKVKSPAQVEKLKGVKPAMTKGMWTKPEGQPKVAPDDDPHEATPTAAEDFAE